MQGRLLPPLGGRFQCFPEGLWREEFGLAAEAGFAAIEWIYDLQGEAANPIADDAGVAAVLEMSSGSGILVRSVCADYFMDAPLLRAPAKDIDFRTTMLVWLLDRCSKLGVSRVVLPFVDASSIESATELSQIADILTSLTPDLARTRRRVAPGDVPYARCICRPAGPGSRPDDLGQLRLGEQRITRLSAGG